MAGTRHPMVRSRAHQDPSAESDRLRAVADDENFPVALRCLPREYREHLHAVYAVARLIDDIGDNPESTPEQRTAQLLDLREDMALVWRTGQPHHPILARLVPTVAACDVAEESFRKLLEANLVDQRITRYAGFADLLQYCTLSADPVGHIVLAVFGRVDATTTALSNQVCTALQLLEHCQDVGEDYRNGRIYLPGQELTAWKVTEQDLAAVEASPALRELMLFQIDRAADLLDAGAQLVTVLTGWARVAIAGYVAGGLATVAALRRTDGDVLHGDTEPRRVDIVKSMVTLLFRARRSDAVDPASGPHGIQEAK